MSQTPGNFLRLSPHTAARTALLLCLAFSAVRDGFSQEQVRIGTTAYVDYYYNILSPVDEDEGIVHRLVRGRASTAIRSITSPSDSPAAAIMRG